MSENPSARSLFDAYRRGGAWEDQVHGPKFDEWRAKTEADLTAAILRESALADLLRRLVEADRIGTTCETAIRLFDETVAEARVLLATIEGEVRP